MESILRFPQVIEVTGKAKSVIKKEVKSGLFPSPVKIGERSIGWPKSEIEAIIRARIAGLSDEAIRRLVAKLTKDRANAIEDAQ